MTDIFLYCFDTMHVTQHIIVVFDATLTTCHPL